MLAGLVTLLLGGVSPVGDLAAPGPAPGLAPAMCSKGAREPTAPEVVMFQTRAVASSDFAAGELVAGGMGDEVPRPWIPAFSDNGLPGAWDEGWGDEPGYRASPWRMDTKKDLASIVELHLPGASMESLRESTGSSIPQLLTGMGKALSLAVGADDGAVEVLEMYGRFQRAGGAEPLPTRTALPRDASGSEVLVVLELAVRDDDRGPSLAEMLSRLRQCVGLQRAIQVPGYEVLLGNATVENATTPKLKLTNLELPASELSLHSVAASVLAFWLVSAGCVCFGLLLA